MKKKTPRRLALSVETLRRLGGSWVTGGTGFEIASDGNCPPSEPDNTCYWGCSADSCAAGACAQG